MNEEEREQKEGELEQLRATADAAHQAAATTPDDEALAKAAETAEEAYNQLKAELDAAPPASDEEDEEGEEDKNIDFEQELKDLEGAGAKLPPPQRTELEKAERGLFFAAKRLKELGGDPGTVVKPAATPPPAPKDDDEDRYVTKEDFAEQEAEKLSRTDAERKVIMHHYKHSIVRSGNIKADIENAFYIANKGRIRRSIDEARRAASVRSTTGSGPGRRPPTQVRAPQLSSGEQAIMRRRGFAPQADGSWQSKRYTMRFATGKGWVTEPKK